MACSKRTSTAAAKCEPKTSAVVVPESTSEAMNSPATSRAYPRSASLACARSWRGRDGPEHDDPHLLTWVHIAEIDSFLRAHQRHGARPLTDAEADTYVAQTSRVARALGATDVPTTTAELAESLASYRPELTASEAAVDTAHFLLREPPLAWTSRQPYRLIAAGAIGLMPEWTRAELRLGGPRGDGLRRAGGALATATIRWGLAGVGTRGRA